MRNVADAAYRGGGSPNNDTLYSMAWVGPQKSDPLAEWHTMNRAMTKDPPEARLVQLVNLLSKIGVGPGQDVESMDEATKRGLVRAAVDGRKLLKSAINSGTLGKRVNGWNIPPRAFGRAGLSNGFVLRVQCLGGIITSESEELRDFRS